MKIGLDLDNVIVDIMASARSVMASDHGLALEEVIETHVYWDPFTHEDDEIAPLLKPQHSFWDRKEVLMGAPVLPGAQEAVLDLNRANLLACYITRRPPLVERHTLQWLKNHGFPVLPVVHVGHTDKSLYFNQCKSSACIEHGVTHMVDDQPHEIESLHAAGIETILVDAPVGRVKRHEFMQQNPHIRVATDIRQAAEILFGEYSRAA